jgi:hypothetical protein
MIISSRVNLYEKRAVELDGSVSKEEIEEIEHLQKLYALRKAIDLRGKWMWLPAALFLLTLVVASIVFFVRVPATAVSLDVRAYALSFTPKSDRKLSELPIRTLAISGATINAVPQELSLPLGATQDSNDLRVRIRSDATEPLHSKMALEGVVARGGKAAFLRAGTSTDSYQIELDAPPTAFSVTVDDSVTVQLPNNAPLYARLPAPSLIGFDPQSTGVLLEFTLAARAPVLLCQQVPITGLNLSETSQYAEANELDPHSWATILSGSISFDELNGTERKLRTGESVRWKKIDGELQTIRLEPGEISIFFVGKVEGLETGPTTHPVSLMPTLFEWLQARHGLILLWGSCIYVFGTVMSVLRWLQLTT